MSIPRARLHYLTRDAGFLWRACGGILLAGILLAAVMQMFRPRITPELRSVLLSTFGEWQLRMKARATRLGQSAAANPRALAAWLLEAGQHMEREAPQWKFDAAAWRLGGIELDPLLRRNTRSEIERGLFADYAQALFDQNGPSREAALRRVHEAGARAPAEPFAAGFQGDFLMMSGRRKEALAAYLREGRFGDARDARHRAFELALALEDKEALRVICSDRRYLRESGARQVFDAARVTGDRWLMLRAVMGLQWRRWSQSLALPLALLSAGIWYAILACTGGGGRWRWLRGLPPVLAGVVSVLLLHLWQGSQRYGISAEDQKTMTHEILQWVLYVGVPEELVKLALFAPFLPFLLRRGSAPDAALTAGCVGLGFAFDENLGYYSSEGGQAAIGRLITANFLHVALTGIAGCWLFELFRSRFHRATEFLLAFLGVCVAHGIYDFATTSSARELGVEIASIVILAVVARYYFGWLKPDAGTLGRHAVSSTAVFCLGSALLVAATIVVSVWQMDSMRGVTDALRSVIAIFPVALVYVREFREI